MKAPAAWSRVGVIHAVPQTNAGFEYGTSLGRLAGKHGRGLSAGTADPRGAQFLSVLPGVSQRRTDGEVLSRILQLDHLAAVSLLSYFHRISAQLLGGVQTDQSNLLRCAGRRRQTQRHLVDS